MSDLIIDINALTFSYDNQPVLDGISLQVHDRDFVGVIGPNGGGKSTLMKIVLGLLEPVSGTVKVFNEKPAIGRKYIGYMPQFKAQTQNYPISVFETVLMGCLTKNIFYRYSRKDKEKARESLINVQADTLIDRPFSQLSGGQQQRVLLARALMCDPKLLILDEPTCSIDHATGKHFFELLTQLNDKMAILIVSHDLSSISNSAKTILNLNRCFH